MKTRSTGTMDVGTLYNKLKMSGDQYNAEVFDSAQREDEGQFQKETPDDRFFQIKQDESGNAYVTLRFLPSVSETGVLSSENYLLHARHYFDVGGKNWFVMNCPWVMGKQSCPICKDNRDLWETDKTLYNIRKAKRTYIYNVYIIKDAVDPSNNGKIFLWAAPVQIHNMIHEKISPKNKLKSPCNVFALNAPVFTLDVKLKTININGKATAVKDFEGSKFSDDMYPLADNEKNAMEILSHIIDVKSLVKEDKYHVPTTEDFTEKYEAKKAKAGKHFIESLQNNVPNGVTTQSVVQNVVNAPIPDVTSVLNQHTSTRHEVQLENDTESHAGNDDNFDIDDFKF